MLSFFGTFLNDDRAYQNGFRFEISDVKNKKRKVNTMSLQVLCSPLLNQLRTTHPGKRVLPFISKKKYCASMTVEAAMVLPLFVFLALALLMPVRALDTERKMRTVLEKQGEEASLYRYMEDAEEEIDENIVLKIAYQKSVPFFSSAVGGIKTDIWVKRRSWIGMDGKLKEKAGSSEDAEGSEEMVYVGKNMGRYHRDRNCHYISNAYQVVSVEEAKAMRDAEERQFQACSICGGMIGKSGTVYVTPGGRHYHGSSDCIAMVSYVRRVPLSEVVYLGACSYCGGK